MIFIVRSIVYHVAENQDIWRKKRFLNVKKILKKIKNSFRESKAKTHVRADIYV